MIRVPGAHGNDYSGRQAAEAHAAAEGIDIDMDHYTHQTIAWADGDEVTIWRRIPAYVPTVECVDPDPCNGRMDCSCWRCE